MAKIEVKKMCGIVMPISSIDNCSDNHWSDVLNILNEAIGEAGFEGNLVSSADDVGIIQKRIIQNLYDNPIVVCDVSCKNPNVMFELGLRLAFDKPTIIIKDDKTSYTFDTSPIEHLEYPRDLRFTQIIEFKELLSSKVKATYDKSINDPDYTTFLKHFGEFTVAKIDKKEVSGQEYIIEELKNLRHSINNLEYTNSLKNLDFEESWSFDKEKEADLNFCMEDEKKLSLERKMDLLFDHPCLQNVSKEKFGDHFHIKANIKKGFSKNKIEKEIQELVYKPFKLKPKLKATLKTKK